MAYSGAVGEDKNVRRSAHRRNKLSLVRLDPALNSTYYRHQPFEPHDSRVCVPRGADNLRNLGKNSAKVAVISDGLATTTVVTPIVLTVRVPMRWSRDVQEFSVLDFVLEPEVLQAWEACTRPDIGTMSDMTRACEARGGG